jgi:hypothetical protein
VAVLDTRTWTSRMLDPAAGSFSAAGDGIVIAREGALRAYALDGAPRFTVSIPSGDAYVSVFGDYGYVWTADKVTLVDLRVGSVIVTLPKPSLYLIAAGS